MLKGAVLHPHARLLEACRLRAVLTAAPGREREVERGRERSREREREVEREREGWHRTTGDEAGVVEQEGSRAQVGSAKAAGARATTTNLELVNVNFEKGSARVLV